MGQQPQPLQSTHTWVASVLPTRVGHVSLEPHENFIKMSASSDLLAELKAKLPTLHGLCVAQILTENDFGVPLLPQFVHGEGFERENQRNADAKGRNLKLAALPSELSPEFRD